MALFRSVSQFLSGQKHILCISRFSKLIPLCRDVFFLRSRAGHICLRIWNVFTAVSLKSTTSIRAITVIRTFSSPGRTEASGRRAAHSPRVLIPLYLPTPRFALFFRSFSSSSPPCTTLYTGLEDDKNPPSILHFPIFRSAASLAGSLPGLVSTSSISCACTRSLLVLCCLPA